MGFFINFDKFKTINFCKGFFERFKDKERSLFSIFIIICTFALPVFLKIKSGRDYDLSILAAGKQRSAQRIKAIIKDSADFIKLIVENTNPGNHNIQPNDISIVLSDSLALAHPSLNENWRAIKTVRLVTESGKVFGSYGEVISNESQSFKQYLKPLSASFPEVNFIENNGETYLARAIKRSLGLDSSDFLFVCINNFPDALLPEGVSLKYYDVHSTIDLKRLNSCIQKNCADLCPYNIQTNVNVYKIINENILYITSLALVSLLLLYLNQILSRRMGADCRNYRKQLVDLNKSFNVYKNFTEQYLEDCDETIEENKEIARFLIDSKSEDDGRVLTFKQEQALLKRISNGPNNKEEDLSNSKKEIDLIEIIEECINLVKRVTNMQGVQITFKSTIQSYPMQADKISLVALILNLLSLALNRVSEKNTIVISADVFENDGQDLPRVTILDDGYVFDFERFKFLPENQKLSFFPIRGLSWSEMEELARIQSFKIICDTTKKRKNRIQLALFNSNVNKTNNDEDRISDQGLSSKRWPENVVPFKKN